jgi:tripartite-type tricarboxylate transporter receptor subunit TctC
MEFQRPSQGRSFADTNLQFHTKAENGPIRPSLKETLEMNFRDSRRVFLAAAAGVAAMFGLPSMPMTQSFLVAGTTSVAYAQAYPSQPIRIIVPFAPGGSTDVVARLISDALSRQLGQAVVIENKGGAGGTIGTMEVVRAAPDGHTLLMASPSITAANPAINPAAKYNPESDLTPIINIAASPTVLAVHPNFPARNFTDFVAEIKKKPDDYTYASPGVGGIIHLQMELLKGLTSTSIRHIPFRGAGQATIAVYGGQVDIILDALPSLLPYLKDGRLVPLVVAAPERIKEVPQVPTFKEVGLEPVNHMGSYGLLGPKGLPTEIVEVINGATRKSIDDPAVRKRIEDSGAIIVANTPAEYAAEIKNLYAQLKTVVAERKLTLE